MEEKRLAEKCFLLVGEAPSAEAAGKIAEIFSGCPYVYFMSAFGQMVIGVYYLPAERRWWIEAVADNPERTLGLARTAVYATDHPAFPAAMEPRAEGNGEAPCGAVCPECPRYGDPCPGCPAPRNFRD